MDNLRPIKTRQKQNENGMTFLTRLLDEVKYDLVPKRNKHRPHTDSVGDFIPFIRSTAHQTTAHLVQILMILPSGLYHVRYTIPNQPKPLPYFIYDEPSEHVMTVKGEEPPKQLVNNGICYRLDRAFSKNEDYPYGSFLMHYTETS